MARGRHLPSSERRLHLIAAATRVIAREGLDRATTRRIAAEADVPLGSIHYVFPDKQALVTAVLDHWVAVTAGVAAERVRTGMGIAAAARVLVRAYVEELERNPGESAALYELVLWARRTPAAGPVAARNYADYEAVVADALAAGARRPVDPERLAEAAQLVITVADGVALQLLASGDGARARRNADLVLGQATGWLESADAP